MFNFKTIICNGVFTKNIRFKSSYTRINKLSKDLIGQNITIKGWIKGIRKMKENVFIDINDGSCNKNIQVVLSNENKPNINFGASFQAAGILSETSKGQLELKVNSCEILGKCPITENYPYTPRQSYPADYIRQYLHLRSRVSSFNSVLRVRNQASNSINNYLNDKGFIQIHTPILTSNDCEGAGEVFRVQPENIKILKQMKKENVPLEEGFFDKKSFLTVSGQLHLEAMSHGLGDVYTFGPTFRAENSKSPVHLSEFYMLEVEKAFVDSIHDICSFLEDMTKSVTNEILMKSESDVINARLKNSNEKLLDNFSWIEKIFPIISYDDAISILEKNKSFLKQPINKSSGLAKDHELFLVKHFDAPIFVVDWPSEMKPFYMRLKKDESLVDAVDFLVPGIGELAGGSVREENYEKLCAKLPDDMQWYLDLRKFGGITTGGFGMGFERYLQFLMNIHNIRDVIPFPRWAHNCDM